MSDQRWLALCGSLRASSSNRAILQAARRLAPPDVEVVLYEGLGELPPFNPDLEEGSAPLPVPVATLRRTVGEADALVIACPEYAHGVPGAFKNLLDWLVGSHEFPEKPVALLNAAARAHHAQSQLIETLSTMNARLLSPEPYGIPLSHNRFTSLDILANPALTTVLKASLLDIKQRLNRS